MHLPHLNPFDRSPLYYLTACSAHRREFLAGPECMCILEEIWHNSGRCYGWFVGRFVIMPDHVHLFATPAAGAISRALWCKAWKSISSRHITKALGVGPPVWQRDTFDHIMRSAESYSRKWNYVADNPVRAGLVQRSEDWPWQGEIHSLAF